MKAIEYHRIVNECASESIVVLTLLLGHTCKGSTAHVGR